MNSGKKFKGIPIIASNMDGVGTFSMAKVLQNYKMLTVLRKHYEPEDWDNAVAEGLDLNYVSICTGTNRIWDEDAPDFLTLKIVLEKYPEIPFITIDVANGYHENFVDFVFFKNFRSSKNFSCLSYLGTVISYVPGRKCPYFFKNWFISKIFSKK